MSLQRHKTDPELGLKVEEYLITKGVNTPMIKDTNVTYSDSHQRATIEESFTQIMRSLRLDLTDDSLIDTPKRIAKMFVDELYWGLKTENFPKMTVVDNKITYDEMVVVDNITSMSSCEHHFVTIDGLAHIAYIPKNKVIGLSKFNRVVEYFSRRPQIQERLTEQIFHTLTYLLDTPDVAVVINAKHYCVKSRGVEDSNSSTTTSKMGGRFRSVPELRAEFLNLIPRKD